MSRDDKGWSTAVRKSSAYAGGRVHGFWPSASMARLVRKMNGRMSDGTVWKRLWPTFVSSSVVRAPENVSASEALSGPTRSCACASCGLPLDGLGEESRWTLWAEESLQRRVGSFAGGKDDAEYAAIMSAWRFVRRQGRRPP